MNFRHIDAVFNDIWSRKFQFFGVFLLVVILSYAVLVWIDFIPEAPSSDSSIASAMVEEVPQAAAETIPPFGADATPDTIIFDSLDRKVAVVNPQERSIEALDKALLSGAVRHPDSADLHTNGTMFLFGHSSYLPVVYNKNYQAFNGIQNLAWGEKIRIQSSDYEYVYRVDRVYEVKASVAEVALRPTSTPRLTLVTCNSFGSKDDRFIVEATLIDSYPLPS